VSGYKLAIEAEKFLPPTIEIVDNETVTDDQTKGYLTR
jgi:hypothetical protein